MGPARPDEAEEHPEADDRCGNHLEGAARAAPQLGPGVGVVSHDPILSVDDQLVVIADADGDRCAPPDLRVARRAPQPLTGRLVERGHERIRALILIEDDAVLVEQRRAGRPVVVVHAADSRVPDLLAGHVDRHQPAAAERGVDALTVGGHRRRRIAVLVVRPVGGPGGHGRFPLPLSVAAAIRQNRRLAAVVGGRGEEDPIAPDHWRRVPAARNRHLPDDVLRRRPRVRVRVPLDQPLARGTAPSRPVAGRFALVRDHADRRLGSLPGHRLRPRI